MFRWWDRCFVCRVWNDSLLVLEVVGVEEVVEEGEEAGELLDLPCDN